MATAADPGAGGGPLTESRWSLPQSVVRDLDPGYFGLVMATGIVSQAMKLDGAARLSGIMLGIAILAYLTLAVMYLWRLARHHDAVSADARDPRRAFGFFTLAAGSDVLAVRLAADGHLTVTAVLLVIGGVSCVLLSYGVPLVLASGNTSGRAARGPAGSALASANGTWFLWPVAAQSVAVGLTSLKPPLAPALTSLAVACWAVGLVLYLLVAALVAAMLFAVPVRPGELTPAYWVFMGASAITVLAGAQILRLPPGPLLAAVHALVAGSSVVLWAFGTWLIPLLVILGIWRHVMNGVPLAYDAAWWSIAFPVGMYGVASHELGATLDVRWLVSLGRDEAWPALAVWALVFAAMIVAFLRRLRTKPADE
jgi:tellurite resistance protein TehA-like permease